MIVFTVTKLSFLSLVFAIQEMIRETDQFPLIIITRQWYGYFSVETYMLCMGIGKPWTVFSLECWHFVSLTLVVITGVEGQLGHGDVVWSVAAVKLKISSVCGLITHKTCIAFCFINGRIKEPLYWSPQPWTALEHIWSLNPLALLMD